ncbi:CAP domain-containing protein [Jannaschia pohangensis]|uniref:Cysteine-rich secretory protein family protein n=1 Tax=Jannaschia pohangensis TaxID=390807 RepID=A0A1I3N899_9RHOB|nr:CAP domain-containing protein [Jannaschia pohangensis]SFJ05541.1 Cysteine-rich secretory protein family protein [Jannaschia pohangensis]
MFLRVLVLMLLAALPVDAAPMADALDLASRERARVGLSALRHDPRLAAAAEVQATFMAREGRIGHVGPGGSSFGDRIRATGYQGCYGAENVAAGQRTSAAVTRSWMGSDGHRQNILNGRMTDGAVAAVRDRNGRLWWAMVLAGPC